MPRFKKGLSDKMKLSVVIPMYNEEKVIKSTLETLYTTLERDFGDGEYEVIVVSDGSSDSSPAIAKAFAEEHNSVKAIGYEKNRGKGCAVRTGMLAAKGDFVLFTDSDLAYGADILAKVYDLHKKSGADVVIGSRAAKGGGYDGYTFLRKLMSKTYLKVVSIAAGFSHSDSQAGLKGFTNEAVHKIFPHCEVDRFAFDLEALMIADRLKLKYAELPIKVINHGESKVNPIKDALNMLGEVRKMKKRIKKLDLSK